VSDDDGTTWYWWNGSSWTTAGSGYTTANTAAEINTNIESLYEQLGSGTFKFKAYLNSDGSQQVELSQVDLGYSAGQVALTAPNGGESWFVGTSQNITWTSSGTVSNNLTLKYSTDGGSTYPNTIATGEANDGTYTWTVADSVGTNNKVKIFDASDTSVKDTSDATFNIANPTITLTSPTGGEAWLNSVANNITWTSVGAVSNNLTIQYSTDSGSTWADIATGQANDGTYLWTPTGINSTQVRVKIFDASRPVTADESASDFAISRGTITLTSPNGGEGWYVYELKNITWTSSGTVDNNLTIQYSTDGGSNWTNIATGEADDGLYSNWLVPDAVSSNCLIRIFDANQTTTVDTSDSVFSILEPSITLTSPNGGEQWIATNTYQITWTSTNGVSDNLVLYYSTDGGSTYPNTIATGQANDGSYDWVVPVDVSSTVKVKIEDGNRTATYDESDAVFDIIPTPTITVTAPDGGEAWYVNTTQNITWSSTGQVSNNLEIRYSTDGGTTWPAGKIIATAEANDGTYSWGPIPDDLSTNCKVKITDLDAPVVNDKSNNPFVIQAPTITVTSPNGGENWTATSSKLITWTTSAGVSDNLTIQYSTDSGSTWTDIATGQVNDGSYTWNPLPDIEYTTCRIKIIDADRPATYDISNTDFTISSPYVTITSPNGGESWKVGTSHTITWSYSDMVSNNLTIEYSTDGGSNWTTIATGETCDGNYTWASVPDAMSTNCLVRITDANRVATTDTSDAAFEIATPTITVTSPNGGESWIVGTQHNITWTSDGTVSNNLTIKYSSDAAHNNWAVVASAQANDGTYNWTIPDDVSSTVKVRVFDADRVTATDDSDADFSITAPTITITSPNGGESWIVGTVHEVTWTTSAGVGNLLTIQYSTDGGSTWTNIATNQANDGSYMWSVADSESSQAQIKLFDQNRPATSDTSDANFTIATPVITVTAPNGGESWIVGTDHNITWTTTGTFSNNLTIQYSSDGGSTWVTESTGEINDGTYTWTVSDAESSQALVRIYDANRPAATDDSDAVFTIATPVITVTAPNGGEQWVRGKTENITWTTTGSFSNNLTIQYSTDSGVNWTDIATGEINDGTYSWDIPIGMQTGTQTRIKIFDANRTAASDISDADFEILPEPTITVTSPNGGEQWIMGTSQNITWTSSGGVSNNLTIKYSADNGTNWTTIATGEANDGTYSWTVPDTEGTQYLVRVYDGNDPSVTDDSDATFNVVSSTITITAPASGDVWNIGSQYNITWSSVGTVNDNLTIQYSSDGGTNWTDIATGEVNDGTYAWIVPSISSSTSCYIRIFDASHTSTTDDSDMFTIAASFTVTAPNGGERWFALNTHTVTWTTDTGSAANVKLEYSTDNGSTWTDIVSSTTNDGSYSWTLPNTHMTSSTALVRVSDVLIPSANDVSDAGFQIDYYDITWEVKQLLPPQVHLTDLSVVDTSGWSEANLNSPIVHSYPYGTYTTTWSQVDYFDKTWRDWNADSDQTILVQMSESTIAPEYKVLSNFAYDASNQQFRINTWVERGGIVLTAPTSCTITIYDQGGNQVQQLSILATDTDPADGNFFDSASGVFWQLWDTGGLTGDLYFAKVDVVYSDVTYSSGLSYNINVPVAIAGLGTTVAADIQALQASIGNDLADQTTQIQLDINNLEASIGADLSTQVGNIQTDITNLSNQVAGYETTQAAFRSSVTTSLSTIESDVGAILQDTSTDLPATIAAEISNQLAKGVQAEILTRPTTIKTGSTATIRFRTTTGLSPTITVYDASNTARVSSAAMTEIGTTGIYEYDLTVLAGWGTGDFTIICQESTKQSVDSLVLTVSSVDLASVSADIASIATTLDTVDDKIDTIDTNVDTLITNVSTINSNTSSVGTDVTTLLSRLGTSDDTSSDDTIFGKIAAARGDISSAQSAIVAYVDTVETVLGTSSDTSSDNTVFGKLAGIESDLDTIGPDATNAATYALTAKTQATTAASTAAEIKTLVSAGKSAETYAAVVKLQSDLTALQSTISKIPEAVSTESITSAIREALGKLGEIAAKEGYKGLVPEAEGLVPGSAASSADMQNIRNSIAELKSLMSQVRSLLDRKVNAPVVKAWMEGR
jgi:hypothetical protein